MAFDYHKTLDSIASKSRLLLERYRLLEKAKVETDAQVESLNKQVALMKKEIETLKADNEYLRLAATIAPSRDDVENARGMITELVREIDRCIVDLTD